VLSLRARARFLAPRYRCGTRVGQLPKSFTTLPPPPPVKRARKFAPVSLHSRGPPFSLAARNATRSSARIATALETRRPPLSLSLSLSLSILVFPRFSFSLAFLSLDPWRLPTLSRLFAPDSQTRRRSALLIDSRRLDRYLITSWSQRLIIGRLSCHPSRPSLDDAATPPYNSSRPSVDGTFFVNVKLTPRRANSAWVMQECPADDLTESRRS